MAQRLIDSHTEKKNIIKNKIKYKSREEKIRLMCINIFVKSSASNGVTCLCHMPVSLYSVVQYDDE